MVTLLDSSFLDQRSDSLLAWLLNSEIKSLQQIHWDILLADIQGPTDC